MMWEEPYDSGNYYYSGKTNPETGVFEGFYNWSGDGEAMAKDPSYKGSFSGTVTIKNI